MALDFSKYPDYYRYRALKLATPMVVGFDAYALQSALRAIGHDPGAIDGYFGSNTDKAVRQAQKAFKITVDGIAGSVTQGRIAQALMTPVRKEYDLPYNLLFGQLTHESGLLLGNYSLQYPNGSYDAGVAQRNTLYTSAKQGFDPADSISALGKNTRNYYDKFVGVKDEGRRWGLAAGAWNAPAFAGYLANEEGASLPKGEVAKPSADARIKLEAYITSAMAYTKYA